MRALPFLAVLLPSLIASAAAAQQGGCPRPVTLLDYDVRVPPPTEQPAAAQHAALYGVAPLVRSMITSGDPRRGDIEWLELGFPTGHGPYGAGTARTAYVISGEILGQEPAITATNALATRNGEVLARGVASIVQAQDAAGAALPLATPLQSAADHIDRFERGKRELGHPFARAPRIEVQSEKPVVDPGSTTLVRVRLLDCDTVPLANRTVTLTATHGTVDPTEVTTDEAGEAHTVFTAPDARQHATIRAEYRGYMTAALQSGTASGSGNVRVRGGGWIGTITMELTAQDDTAGASQRGSVSTQWKRSSRTRMLTTIDVDGDQAHAQVTGNDRTFSYSRTDDTGIAPYLCGTIESWTTIDATRTGSGASVVRIDSVPDGRFRISFEVPAHTLRQETTERGAHTNGPRCESPADQTDVQQMEVPAAQHTVFSEALHLARLRTGGDGGTSLLGETSYRDPVTGTVRIKWNLARE